MKPSASDPENIVPVFYPDSTLGRDAVPPDESEPRPATVLPPRRSASDQSENSQGPTRRGDKAIRIESKSAGESSAVTSQKLEVNEISAPVIRLEETEVPTPKGSRPIRFHKKTANERITEGPESEEPAKHSDHLPVRWIIGSCVVVILIIAGVLIALPSINAPNALRTDDADVAFKVENEVKLAGIEAAHQLLIKQPEAERIFLAYARATHPDEILPFVRNGNQLRDTLSRNWRSPLIPKDWSPARDLPWSTFEISGLICAHLTGSFADHSPFSAYYVLEGDRVMLDWKATSAYSTATIAQLAKNQGDPSEIRAEISPATFYNATWPESEYQSYYLSQANGEELIWCYARRGEKPESGIAPLFYRSDIVEDDNFKVKPIKVTLRLERGPEGSSQNQWLIAEFLHIHWITP